MHHDDTTPDTIPYGYCHCGCGQKTRIATQSDRRAGIVRGEPNRYLQGHAGGVAHFVDSDGMKTCSKCMATQPATNFYRKDASRDGYENWCKNCTKAYRKAHRVRVEESNRRWRANNPDRCREYSRRNSRNRRAMKRAGGGNVPFNEWQSVLDRFNGKCAKCGSTENIHMDHVVPLAKGGKHSPDNIQPLCQTCNLRKGVKVEDYRGKMYRPAALPLDDMSD